VHLLFRGRCVGEFLGEGNAQLEAADDAANDVERADEVVLFLRFSGVLLGAGHAPLRVAGDFFWPADQDAGAARFGARGAARAVHVGVCGAGTL